MTERQRAYHALHGNGTKLITKINTDGIPMLAKEAQSAEEFIEYQLDLSGWCAMNGCLPYIIGPAPAPPVLPEKLAEHNEKLALGLRYVCASLAHPDLRASVATHGNNRGPVAFEYLRNEFLQGTELQPALNIIVDNLRLKPGENIVPWKQRFLKFTDKLDPQPHPSILCAKFTKAITSGTNGVYEECVTSANAVDRDHNDFRSYAKLLSQLAAQKLQRTSTQIREHLALNSETRSSGEAPTDLEALSNRIQELEAHLGDTNRSQLGGNKGDQRTNQGGGRDSSRGAPPDRPCVKCGEKGHNMRDCSVEVACEFTFPNGEKCGRQHLARFCWFKDPSKCRDPKIRALIDKKLAAKSTTSGTSSHYLQHDDDGEFHCVTITEGAPTNNHVPTTCTAGGHKLQYFCICQECPYGSMYICTECPLTKCTVCDPQEDVVSMLLSRPDARAPSEEWEDWIDWEATEEEPKPDRCPGSPTKEAALSPDGTEGNYTFNPDGPSVNTPAKDTLDDPKPEEVYANTACANPEDPKGEHETGANANGPSAAAGGNNDGLSAMQHDIVNYYLAPHLDDATAVNLLMTNKEALAMMTDNLTERVALREHTEVEAIDSGYQSAAHRKK